MPLELSSKRLFSDLFFLVILSSFFLIYHLHAGSLASWDEALYASVAKEMAASGDYFHLTLNGSPWADKPPLALWATAFFYKVFGVGEGSARLFSALCGVATVAVTYLLGCRVFNRWTGLVGALVLLSSEHYIRFVRFGMLDSPLVLFLTLSLYFFWLGRGRNRYLIFSGIALGLAVMTKGFAAFFALPVIWLYCVWSGETAILMRSSYWIGMMIAAAIALPWHLYEMLAYRGEFLEDAVFKHLIARTTTALDGHTGNYYFYIRTVINKYHPWILLGIVSAPFFLYKAIRERSREFVFISSWIFSILLIITLIRTKLSWYVLPVYPALSLTVAYFLTKIFKEKQAVFIQIVFVVIMALHVPYSHIWDHDYSRDIKGIAPAVARELGEGEKIYLYNYHESPAVTFYLGRRDKYLDDEKAFVNAARSERPFACLIHEERLGPLEKKVPGVRSWIVATFENLHLLHKK